MFFFFLDNDFDRELGEFIVGPKLQADYFEHRGSKKTGGYYRVGISRLGGKVRVMKTTIENVLGIVSGREAE